MNTHEHRARLNAITESIVGCAYRVSNTLGCGFLEKVYENVLLIELRKSGLEASPQYGIKVRYENVVVGEYTADLLVDREMLVELKAAKGFEDIHTAQCLNYLKATGLKVCVLPNFGKPKLEVKRTIND